MNLMSRLFAESRSRQRLRAARAEIRRAERAMRKRQRPANDGYDELRDPLFLIVMVAAVVVLCLDLTNPPGWVEFARAIAQTP
ncbi:hypothetical protein [Variovorax gossypii]